MITKCHKSFIRSRMSFEYHKSFTRSRMVLIYKRSVDLTCINKTYFWYLIQSCLTDCPNSKLFDQMSGIVDTVSLLFKFLLMSFLNYQLACSSDFIIHQITNVSLTYLCHIVWNVPLLPPKTFWIS